MPVSSIPVGVKNFLLVGCLGRPIGRRIGHPECFRNCKSIALSLAM